MNDTTLPTTFTAQWESTNTDKTAGFTFIIRDQRGKLYNDDSGWMVTQAPDGKGWTLIQYSQEANINHGTYSSAERAMDMANFLMVKAQPLIGRFEKVEGKEEYYLVYRNGDGDPLEQSEQLKARLVNPERPEGDWELVKCKEEDGYPKLFSQMNPEAWRLIRDATFHHIPT